MSPLVVCLCVGLCAVSSALAQEYAPSAWQNYPQQQQPVYNTGGGVGQGPGCGLQLNDVVSNIASYKSNILATGLSAAVAALLAKLPALIFLKVLILKLIVVPAMFVLVALPVLMPLLMMLTPMMMSMMNMMSGGSSDSTTTTTAAPTGRSSAEADSKVADADEVLRAVLSSHKCLERVACKLGVRDARSEYRKPISWMLKQLQTMVPAGYRERVRSYRQAYISGTAKGECQEESYPCQTPELIVRQESRTFRVL